MVLKREFKKGDSELAKSCGVQHRTLPIWGGTGWEFLIGGYSQMNGVSRHPTGNVSKESDTWMVLFLGIYTFLLLLFTNSLVYRI